MNLLLKAKNLVVGNWRALAVIGVVVVVLAQLTGKCC